MWLSDYKHAYNLIQRSFLEPLQVPSSGTGNISWLCIQRVMSTFKFLKVLFSIFGVHGTNWRSVGRIWLPNQTLDWVQAPPHPYRWGQKNDLIWFARISNKGTHTLDTHKNTLHYRTCLIFAWFLSNCVRREFHDGWRGFESLMMIRPWV